MGISTRGIYGLSAVYYILLNSHERTVQAGEISKAIGVPQNYLEQLLFVLRNKNFLRSTRGPKGGYYIPEETKNLTIGTLLDTLENGSWHKEIETYSPALNLFWGDVNARINELYNIKLVDLLKYEERVLDQSMYHI
ncbi:hypothetical protein CCZ01_03895 [Helicobacter monodelphidis]|uniref:RrF2 family transcriptional regulator n=1 Tax=Helicobacter sp. 15-1451 TaxID=2004995 RepID=UPI000DCBE4AE|nr:Rrf2 family transcriptional regulator [Helicobacter sp. 15-1451]RAX58225.1 hypothetical protein CCZ01_03895 [Helicobacter sp. 15-1451]